MQNAQKTMQKLVAVNPLAVAAQLVMCTYHPVKEASLRHCAVAVAVEETSLEHKPMW